MESPSRENSDEINSVDDLHRELKKLEKLASNFTIIGDGTINFQGNLEHGFSAHLEDGS